MLPSPPTLGACLLLDALLWMLLFLWMGAPIFNSGQALWYTLSLSFALALLVASTWPVAPRASAGRYQPGFLRWTRSVFASLRSSQAVESSDAHVSKQDVNSHATTATTMSPNNDNSECVSSEEFYACFVLCGTLLLGGLVSQLDWQVVFQKWPHPHIVLYAVVRTAMALTQPWWRRAARKEKNSGATEAMKKKRV